MSEVEMTNEFDSWSKRHKEYPETTMFGALELAAKRFPTAIAYEFMGKKTSFAQFMQNIDTVAKAYLAMGISKGDRVTICMPNCPQALCSFYALNRIGAVSNMIHFSESKICSINFHFAAEGALGSQPWNCAT